MHAGRQYTLKEFLLWTRRDIYWIFGLSLIPTLLYKFAGWTWLAVPWVPIAMIGTAAAFIVGFKNTQTYNRLWEARQIYGAIVNGSRSWGIMARDFVTNLHATAPVSPAELYRFHRELIYRHIAWLTALRYQLREPRVWENMNLKRNIEYRSRYNIAEHEETLDDALHPYLSEQELQYVLGKKNRATQIISLQSRQLKELMESGLIDDFRHTALAARLTDFYEQQGKCERIKNFPYPRQFATINLFFIRLFVYLVPFGMLNEFAKLGEHLIWLTVPFSMIVSWVFNSMERVGESTENPFEGGANDVPITALSRTIEIDLREMLDEKDLPPAIVAKNNILL